MKELMNKYYEVLRRFNASGHHSNDIWTYTTDTDILYCHQWLEHLNHPQVTRLFTEGNQIPHVLDTETIPSKSQTSSDILCSLIIWRCL